MSKPVTEIKLDPATASPFNGGIFEGWGTSLCWWANRLGAEEGLTRQAARAFFSEEGLGLDIARYNLGGGDDPAHHHIMRSDSRVPGVWDDFSADGGNTGITFDIGRDERQLRVAKAAMAANPNLYFEGFSNSPPYFMTVSGCTGGGIPKDSDNLRPDMYGAFGRFIARAARLFRGEGIVFQSYSPMNEPDTDYWGAGSPKQEGCRFSPGESQSKAIIAVREALDAEGLFDVQTAGMDETELEKTVRNFAKLSPKARAALGRIDTHSYLGEDRAGVKSAAMAAGKNLWQSEVDGPWDGLQLAEHIVKDMNGMQPAAWITWNIVDFYRDSGFIDPTGSRPEAGNVLDPAGRMWGFGMADFDRGKLYLANKYYFFGQFTRYIKPGDSIILSSDNTLAAFNRATGDIKIVAVNSSAADRGYSFDLSSFDRAGSEVDIIRTNNLAGEEAERWKKLPGATVQEGKIFSAQAKAGTVTTYVIHGQKRPMRREY